MSNNGRKFLFVILSVLMSAVMWLYVSSVESREEEKDIRNIPLTYIGEESLESRNLSVISVETPPLSITFSGRRGDLNRINNANVSVTIDLSQVKHAGEDIRCAYDVVLPDNVRNSLRAVSYSDRFITLFVDQVESKTVEVRLISDITTAEGYMMDRSVIEPHEIRMRGPSSILRKVVYAEAVLNRADVDYSIDATLSYTLKDEDGNDVDSDAVTSEPQTVHVMAPVLKTKIVALDVEIREGGGLTIADNINYSITPDHIMVSGDPTVIDGLNILRLDTIDLSKIETNTFTREIKIIIPNDCYNLSGEESAVVTVEIVNAQTRQITTSNIEIINEDIPNGYMIRLITTDLRVTIRGPEATIGYVNPIHVRAVVDLSGQTLQADRLANIPAALYVDGYNRVGVVGDYYVILEVVPVEDEPLIGDEPS